MRLLPSLTYATNEEADRLIEAWRERPEISDERDLTALARTCSIMLIPRLTETQIRMRERRWLESIIGYRHLGLVVKARDTASRRYFFLVQAPDDGLDMQIRRLRPAVERATRELRAIAKARSRPRTARELGCGRLGRFGQRLDPDAS